MDPLHYLEKDSSKKYDAFYQIWLHDLWGLWVIWTLPQFDTQYYSQNIFTLMFKEDILFLWFESSAQNIAKRLS